METSGVLPTRSLFDQQKQIDREVREAERGDPTARQRLRLLERERQWYGRSEVLIREEMEHAVRRRHPAGVTWPGGRVRASDDARKLHEFTRGWPRRAAGQ